MQNVFQDQIKNKTVQNNVQSFLIITRNKLGQSIHVVALKQALFVLRSVEPKISVQRIKCCSFQDKFVFQF